MSRQWAVIGIVVAGLALGAAALTWVAPDSGVRISHRAPEFHAVDLATRDSVSLADSRGSVTLVNIWATWCVPCLQATPHLKALAASFAKEDFLILGISVDDDRKKLEGYLAKEKIGWPQYWDQAKMLTFRTFRVSTFPTYLVVDPEGKVAKQFLGPVTAREIESAIAAAGGPKAG